MRKIVTLMFAFATLTILTATASAQNNPQCAVCPQTARCAYGTFVGGCDCIDGVGGNGGHLCATCGFCGGHKCLYSCDISTKAATAKVQPALDWVESATIVDRLSQQSGHLADVVGMVRNRYKAGCTNLLHGSLVTKDKQAFQWSAQVLNGGGLHILIEDSTHHTEELAISGGRWLMLRDKEAVADEAVSMVK